MTDQQDTDIITHEDLKTWLNDTFLRKAQAFAKLARDTKTKGEEVEFYNCQIAFNFSDSDDLLTFDTLIGYHIQISPQLKQEPIGDIVEAENVEDN